MDRRPFSLRDAAGGIWRRKGKVSLFAIGTLTLVVVATIFMPKSYYSESKLFVRLGRENVGMDPTTTFGDGPSVFSMPQSREEEMNSIVELIKSKSLLQQVVDAVGTDRILKRDSSAEGSASTSQRSDTSATIVDQLVQSLQYVGLLNRVDDHEKAVIKLRDNISVKAIRKSNVIAIFFESYEPNLAQEVVKKLVELYVSQHVKLHRNDGSVEFLEQQTENARIELADAEEAFEDLKIKTGLFSLTDQRKVLVDRLAKLKNSYLETVAAASAMESEVARLKQELENLPETLVISETIGAGNEGIDLMRQELFKLQIRRAELLAKHSANHPSVQQIERQMEQSRNILVEAEKQTTESVMGRNSVYDETKIELVKKEPQLISLRTKAAELQSQLADVKKQLEKFNNDETKFVEIQRAVAIGDQTYRKYKRNLEQAEIDNSLESQELSNLSVAQVATVNPKPIRPNKLINLALGLVAGVFGGCALAVLLEYFDPSLRTQEDIESALDLPVVASIPPLSQSQLPNTRQTQAS